MGKNLFEVTLGFDQDIVRLSGSEREMLIDTLELFLSDPHHPTLRNHPLRENEQSIRSLTISDDLRLIIRVRSDHSFLLMRVGTHDDVY